jgi:type I restriction enzyme M protein
MDFSKADLPLFADNLPEADEASERPTRGRPKKESKGSSKQSSKKCRSKSPNQSKSGEIIEDIDHIRRSDLVTPESLIPEFNNIRNHLAGNATGITRDETIAREVLKLLFCKIYDEQACKSDEYVTFCVFPEENPALTKARIQDQLLRKVINSEYLTYPKGNGWNDEIILDPESVAYTVCTLQRYEISTAGRDIVGQAFEAFIGSALRGEEGQFFTPKNIVKMMVKLLDPKPGERVLDPACGSGGFLAAVSEHINARHTPKKNPSFKNSKNIFGIEKDSFLASVAQAYMSVIQELNSQVYCEDSLKVPSVWHQEVAENCELGSFDIVLTNPPFGAKIPIKGEQTLQQYGLAKNWKKDKQNVFNQTEKLVSQRPPQILFIERCLHFLKDGGRMGIVLPDGILGNVNDGYVRAFLSDRVEVIAIVDCPLETFLPSTPTKTSVLILQKIAEKGLENRDLDKPVFMAIAEKCGHNRRGNPLYKDDGTLDDDFPVIAEKFMKWKANKDVGF